MKKIVAILFAVMSLSVFADTWTDPDTGITWTYTIKNGEASVGGGNNWSTAISRSITGEVTIPSVLGGYPVTSIGWYAFDDCRITSITIPLSVTDICGDAFRGCYLTSVTIPSSVTSIGFEAFRYCSDLASVTIQEGVMDIGSYAFSDCTYLASVTIPEGVTSVGAGAFQNCCSLVSATIHGELTYIESDVFSGCNFLSSVTIPASASVIAAQAFNGCSNLTSVTIPEGVWYIGYRTFGDCGLLKSVEIPSSMKTIDWAFEGCSSLETVYVRPGDKARVKGLMTGKGVDVDTLKFVERKLVDGPYKYEDNGVEWTYVVKDGEAIIGGDPLSSRAEMRAVPESTAGRITIPSEFIYYPVTGIGDYAFDGCKFTSVTIPEGVTSIGAWAFCNCTKLTSATIPSSVTSLGRNTFASCAELESVTIPDGVTRIDMGLFWDCVRLKSVTIPSSVISIGESAFSGCVKLASVVIPLSVKCIDKQAFENCSALASVTISSRVEIIGYQVFLGCSSLTGINVDAANRYYRSIDGALYNKGATELICCPGGAKSVTVPSSVTSINSSAFLGCSALETIYVSVGDTERVRELISQSDFDVGKLTFVENKVFADADALKAAFGEKSSVVRNLTSEEELMKFNEFLGKCGITAASQISDKQKEYAYESFRMSAITVEPRLFENEPKLKIHEFKQGEGGWSVSISLKAGGEEIAMAKRALEEHISVGNKLTEITSKPDIVASPSEDGSSLTFTIAPPEGKQAFIMVRL